MSYRVNPLYKKLLLLVLVFGPVVWLMFTADGKRRTDLVVLYLFGKQELNLAIENLHSGMTEREFRGLFPELELSCTDAPSSFGDRMCSAEVGSFSAIPTRAFTLFLVGDGLRAAKVNYRRAYHGMLRDQIDGRLGQRAERSDENPNAVSWMVSDGMLLMPAAEPDSDAEAALLWLSADVLQRRAAG